MEKNVIFKRKKLAVERRKLFERRKKSLEAGYAFFVATGLLCIVSFLCLSLAALSGAQVKKAKGDAVRFYKNLSASNDAVLSEWKNKEADRKIEID